MLGNVLTGWLTAVAPLPAVVLLLCHSDPEVRGVHGDRAGDLDGGDGHRQTPLDPEAVLALGPELERCRARVRRAPDPVLDRDVSQTTPWSSCDAHHGLWIVGRSARSSTTSGRGGTRLGSTCTCSLSR